MIYLETVMNKTDNIQDKDIPNNNSYILMSISQKWFDLISNGEKTIEIRKTKPKGDFSGYVLFYVSKTGATNKILAGKIIGYCKIEKITRFTESEESFRLSKVSKEFLESYRNNKDLFAWNISNFTFFMRPHDISEFGFRLPPQSWCYIKPEYFHKKDVDTL